MRLVLLLGLAVLLPTATASAQIALGQSDDFQDGTTQGWRNGFGTAPSITNQPGGPGGLSDRFLRVISDGGGSRGKLVVFNTVQWTGNYTAAGVEAIAATVNNLGTTNLALRVWLEGPGGEFVSTEPFLLLAGSGWRQAVFAVTPSALTPTGGATDVLATLAGVTKLRIYHSPTATAPPPAIVATLGLDDITAGPSLSFDLAATATSPLTVPAGGMVSFVYAIANNTGSAASGQFWFTASPGGAAGVIRSGTLPGGQILSGTYTQPIPLSAAAGTYTYCLRIGQFPGTVEDEECFTLVVTSAPRQVGSERATPWAIGEATGWGEAPLAEASQGMPSTHALHPATPNPFAGRTTLRYDLTEATAVRLVVHDLLGREVARLVDGEREAGTHTAALDLTGLPSGSYLVRMTTASGFAETRRLTLLR